MSMTMAPKITRNYPGRLKDARKAMEKDAEQLAKQGYMLSEEAWEPTEKPREPSRHKSHGLLWKMTHPVGMTIGAARFVGTTAIASLPSSDRGTLTVTFDRPAGPPE